MFKGFSLVGLLAAVALTGAVGCGSEDGGSDEPSAPAPGPAGGGETAPGGPTAAPGTTTPGNTTATQSAGEVVVFHRAVNAPYPAARFELIAMNVDASAETKLTNSDDADTQPSIAPSGDAIVYTKASTGGKFGIGEKGGGRDIYLYDVKSGSTTRLTDSSGDNSEPTFSPDGQTIAFVSTRDGNEDIYTMARTGSSVSRLTNNSAADNQPAYAPDGHIFFRSTRNGGSAKIYSMNSSGQESGLTQVTSGSGEDQSPAVSSTGKLAFSSNRDGNFEIYVSDMSGKQVTRITQTPQQQDTFPAWTRSGDIVYQAGSGSPYHSGDDPRYGGDAQIFKVSPTGAMTQLTNAQSSSGHPTVGGGGGFQVAKPGGPLGALPK